MQEYRNVPIDTKANDILDQFSKKSDQEKEEALRDIHSPYSRCVDVLKRLTLREVNLIWKMRGITPDMYDTIEKMVDKTTVWRLFNDIIDARDRLKSLNNDKAKK